MRNKFDNLADRTNSLNRNREKRLRADPVVRAFNNACQYTICDIATKLTRK